MKNDLHIPREKRNENSQNKNTIIKLNLPWIFNYAPNMCVCLSVRPSAQSNMMKQLGALFRFKFASRDYAARESVCVSRHQRKFNRLNSHTNKGGLTVWPIHALHTKTTKKPPCVHDDDDGFSTMAHLLHVVGLHGRYSHYRGFSRSARRSVRRRVVSGRWMTAYVKVSKVENSTLLLILDPSHSPTMDDDNSVFAPQPRRKFVPRCASPFVVLEGLKGGKWFTHGLRPRCTVWDVYNKSTPLLPPSIAGKKSPPSFSFSEVTNHGQARTRK